MTKTCLGGLVLLAATLMSRDVNAGTTTFFSSNQVATLVATGTTSDTWSSEGYQFTCTRDKLFTGGVGLTNPIGRSIRVPWPQGLEAQAVTAGLNPGGAQILIQRTDGLPFALSAFTLKLLANTAGAGGSLEVMPLVDGEDALPNPVFFDATGYGGNVFTYTIAPSYLGTTASLTNYPVYKLKLYVDFALTMLSFSAATPNHAPTLITLTGDSLPENAPPGTALGTFTTDDPDAGDTFSYSLAAGPGDADNANFSIQGNELVAEASYNFELQGPLSIRVAAFDQGGLSTQAVFSLHILDVDEPAPRWVEPPRIQPEGTTFQWESLANHTYTILVSTNLQNGFTILESNVPGTPPVNAFVDPTPPAEGLRFWQIVTDP